MLAAIGTFLLVKVPMFVGYIVITKDVLVPVAEGIINGINDGIKQGNKDLEEKKQKVAEAA